MRSLSAKVLVVPVMFFATGGTLAHSYPQSTSRPANGTVADPPHEVAIAFTEGVEPRYSPIEVTGVTGGRVDGGQAHLAAGDATHLAVGLRDLPPGTYTVVWHAMSVDTHKTEGTYYFAVADKNAMGVSLEHVWSRPTPSSNTPGVVYFTVITTGQPDKLVGVSTPIAASAELHETVNEHGVVKMRPVQSVSVDPGKPVTFKPGGYHVMLMGLKSSLKAGDSFPLTLTFEHAQPVTVTAKVEAAAGMDHGHAGMEGMPGMQGH